MVRKESKLQQLPQSIIVAEKEFPISFRNSSKAKRLSLRVSPDRERLTITLPTYWEHNEVIRFITQCKDWLANKLQQWGPLEKTFTAFSHGSHLPILGKDRQIHIDALNSEDQIVLKDEALIVPSKLNHPRLIHSYLSGQLYDYVCEKSNQYAESVSESINVIRVKNLRSSYGLCSSQRILTYAHRLIYAPIEVIDYVCAHEVSHLKHMNHSPAFWKTVEFIQQNYKTHKMWVKTHGHTLLQYISL